ncbi:hypothetical protein Nos7524_4908 [Nostoc sp. PCC 7524]|uniref:hypothetical protein n=1 Tax=Nostoc sp. (strain ATCC 29411 / PCC 7524) TaxID=28072 RepID=UPI00029EF4A4|nr:hypothetical protein [Nostoc sp. PCC 7524]AFY50634.1 hypothetical protein Nos7524_4908 [Nostoc sp. PCC 7524]
MLRYRLLSLLTITLSPIFLFPVSSSIAETPSIPKHSDAPLELSLLTNPKQSIVTGNTIKLQGLTIPSLWLTQALSENKLLDNWIAYPATEKEVARVDVIVNQQIWSLLDYLERYNFVNRLGNTARKDNYNVRVFNYQEDLLATYTCNFAPKAVACNIQMNFQNKLGLPPN